MNIYDVSKKAEVSIATVSRVLNGNPNVSEKTRAHVLEVMEELVKVFPSFPLPCGSQRLHSAFHIPSPCFMFSLLFLLIYAILITLGAFLNRREAS